jgi:cell division protein ZapA (FtsZ GTPase activity inhibitor)
METYRVRVLGNEYSVRADDGSDHVQKVARIVDKQMKQINRQFQAGSAARTAVLACMNIVDGQLKADEDRAEWVRRRVGTLIEKLETVT